MINKILVLDPFTNGHEATTRFIRKMGWRKADCEIIYCGSHSALLKRLCEGPAYGVAPVYNSIRGEITDVTGQLLVIYSKGYDLKVVAEMDLQIDHYLMAGSHVASACQLERVMSKEEAMGQCDKYLQNIGIGPDRRSKRDSTGSAAKKVSLLKPGVMIGAIAPKCAARAYGLKILAEKIQDVKSNKTTFRLLENKALVKPVTVGIIGIDGRFGKVLKKFFESLQCTVIGSDPKLPGMKNGDVVNQAEVVIFAIPIRVTPVVIRSVLKHTREDQLFMDITSVKQPAMEAMLAGKAQVVGLHPMFAPEVSFEGQTIVVCPARLELSHWKTWVVNMLAKTGSKIKWGDPPEHDSYMATVQSSPQLATFVNAVLIREMGVSVTESLTFTSPFYRMMFSMMGRLLSQDPDLYSAIFMKNPATIPMLENRIAIEVRMLKMIREYDRDAFRRLFKRVKRHFGDDIAKEANEFFLRLNAVTKTAYGLNSGILEFGKSDNQPGLLKKILHVFERRGVNLTGINYVSLDDNRLQFAVSYGQPKTSENVRRALQTIQKWERPRVRVIS